MPKRRPPGPTSALFGLNQILKARRDMLAFYSELHAAYGDAARVRLGPYVQHVFFHPDQIKEVLLTKADCFEKIARVRAVLSQWDGDGLVLSEGEFWRRQRRLMQPAFHHDRVAGMADTMVELTAGLRDEWAARCASGGGHCDVEVNDAMTALTLNIASKTLFGADVSDQTARLGEAIALLSDEAVRELQEPVTLPRWFPAARVRRKWEAIELIDRTTRDIIAERRASGEDRGDLLSMLLRAVDEEGDGGRMTDEQARDEAVTLFLAGHDTSAAALTWLFYHLAREPDVRARVERELDALGGAPPRMADLKRLPFLEMVVKETLRINPPAVGIFPRQAKETVEIGGYRVRRGEQVQLLSFVTQRDPRWFPAPERFDPERFAPGRVEEIPPHAYFPFGAGPRVCIGRQFALVELGLVAATLLQSLSVHALPGAPAAGLHARLSLRPAGGLRLRWTLR